MKKMSKLTRKLFLSAIALGLAVVTLTTTTFAWYTTSATATAGTGQANTSTSTADSSLMISTNGSVFGPTATLPTAEIHMIPLQWKNGFVGKDENVAGTAGDYYEFTLYFKTTSEESAKVYIQEITLTNTKELSALTKYDNLLGKNNNTNGAPTADKYVVDVVKALDMVVTSGNNATFATNKETKSYALNQTGKGVDGFGDNVNANAYYDAFMNPGSNETSTAAETYNSGLTLLKLSNVTDASEIGEVPTGTESVLKVTFAIYLNGWDQYCFDACKGQSFSVNIVFTTEKAESE